MSIIKKNNRGVSALGVCHPLYDVESLIDCFAKTDSIRIRWLDHFFNSKTSGNMAQVMRLPKLKEITAHIINCSGVTHGRTCPHEITFKETTASLNKKISDNDPVFMSKFRARCLAVKKIAGYAPNGTLKLSISPMLEHQNVPKKGFDNLANVVREVFGDNIPIISAPYGTVRPVRGYLREIHGNSGGIRADYHDLDGTDFETIDVLKWARSAEKVGSSGVMIWGEGDNGNQGQAKANKEKPGSWPWLPPDMRKHWTTKREFRTYAAFVADGATDPAPPPYEKDITGLLVRPARDGEKVGFTWKQGEGKMIAVAVFPSGEKPASVVIKKNGKVLSIGSDRGLLHGTKRKIFWLTQHTTNFPESCVCVVDNKYCYVLGKPQFRID